MRNQNGEGRNSKADYQSIKAVASKYRLVVYSDTCIVYYINDLFFNTKSNKVGTLQEEDSTAASFFYGYFTSDATPRRV